MVFQIPCGAAELVSCRNLLLNHFQGTLTTVPRASSYFCKVTMAWLNGIRLNPRLMNGGGVLWRVSCSRFGPSPSIQQGLLNEGVAQRPGANRRFQSQSPFPKVPFWDSSFFSRRPLRHLPTIGTARGWKRLRRSCRRLRRRYLNHEKGCFHVKICFSMVCSEPND